MSQIDDDRIQISHEDGKIVFRVDPSVPMGSDHGEGIIPMGALLDISDALQ